MLLRTWNWIRGLVCIVLVALIWIAASFVVQSVVDGGVSPFLISYICNSLFVVYIPLVELVWWIKRKLLRRERQGEVQDENRSLTNAEKAKLLESTTASSSDSEPEVGLVIKVEDEATASPEGETSGLKGKRLLSRKETARISAVICPIWFLAQFTFNLSLKYTTVTSNTVLSSTSTLFTFILSVIFLAEAFTVLKIVSIVLCMAGTVIVALGDSESHPVETAPRPVFGDIICILSAVFYACYTSLIRKKFPDETKGDEEVSTALFLGYLGLFNALMFAPVMLLLHFTGVEPLHRLTTRQLGLVVGKGIFDNVVSDYLWAEAVLLTSTTVATAGLTLQVPISAVVDSLRGHAPGPLNMIGAVAVLLGFFGINQPADCCQRTPQEASSVELEGSKPRIVV